MSSEPQWLAYAKKLQAIAQAGLTYSKDQYDRERFEQIREVSIEMVQSYTDQDYYKIKDLFASESGYQTPKIDVRAAIFQEDKILLVKEKNDGLWSLPGGFADVDTSLKEAVRKEVKEEAGIEATPKRVISIYDYRNHHSSPLPYTIYKIFVECEYMEGNFETNIETSEAQFFSLDRLPSLSTKRVTAEQIQMCFKVRNKEVHEAYFD